MCAQALVQARMDANMKDSVAAIYDVMGIDLSHAAESGRRGRCQVRSGAVL